MGIWGKKADTWVSDKLGQSRTTSRVSARWLGAGLLAVLVVVAFMFWFVARNDVDPWADVCQPPVNAQLPAGAAEDYDVGSVEVTEFDDGTSQVTGYIRANDESYYFDCRIGADQNVADVTVSPQ